MVDMLTGPHNGHLLVHALKKHADKPVLHIGEQALTGGELAEQISRFIAALQELGLGTGSPVGF